MSMASHVPRHRTEFWGTQLAFSLAEDIITRMVSWVLRLIGLTTGDRETTMNKSILGLAAMLSSAHTLDSLVETAVSPGV
jgi:hypothetical protein